eukprot:TRINITY_DN44751_c0_g1_i1.p1 TRINITY_DN44751_c0_g1~~TRINITY_DN44751_c0_g1_i1.p1  ORF type:complete len:224 (-),score=36.01 TRINITY_DN44751_c0_g1_i1:328-921(-)
MPAEASTRSRGDETRREGRDGPRETARETARGVRPGPYDRPAGIERALEGSSKGKGRGVPGSFLTGSNMMPVSRPKALDRAKKCPFLLRIFHKIGGHHGLEAFAVRGKEPVDTELQVYIWHDMTLRELADLVKDVAPEARSHNAKLAFRLIYPDKAGRNVMTELGTVTAAKRGPDDEKPLSASKFQTGDLLDLAIYV